MADISTRAAAPYIKHDVEEAVMLGNPHLDNLMTIVVALGSEIWAGRQRLNVIESLLESEGKVTQDMVEQFVPSEEQEARWEADREAMVQRVYSVLARNAKPDKPFTQPYADAQEGSS